MPRTPRERFALTKLYGDVLELIDATTRDPNELPSTDLTLLAAFPHTSEDDLRTVLAQLAREGRISVDTDHESGVNEYQTLGHDDNDGN